MFPLSHIYFAERLMDNPNEYILLGSIYPDAVISSRLGRDTTHYNTKDLYCFFRGKDNQMRDFAIGAMSHGVDMKGLDYYSDEGYQGYSSGYCFVKAAEIEEDVITCCNIPPEWGLWKAHNFIEMAFELYLYRNDCSLIDKFNNILQNNELIRYVCIALAEYYNLDSECLVSGLNSFSKFFEYGIMDEKKLACRYKMQLKARHGIEMYNLTGAAAIIEHALDIIKPDIYSFFDYTVTKVKEVIDKITNV